MDPVLNILLKRLRAGKQSVLATLITSSGSTPRKTGARLLTDEKGTLLAGTIGGGMAEAKVLEYCSGTAETGLAQTLAFDMSNTYADMEGMVCGGKITVFIEVIHPSQEELCVFEMLSILQQSDELKQYILITKLSNHPVHILYGLDSKTVVAGTHSSLDTITVICNQIRNTGIYQASGEQYFAELIKKPWTMLIMGGGHVSVYTAKIAVMTGFHVCVIDDRKEFLNPERFPNCDIRILSSFKNCFSGMNIGLHTFIVIVTRGHRYDAEVLDQALCTQAGYIGMIGSRRKRAETYDLLLSKGFTEAKLATVHSPIGLDICAETPEEIAVSILAECIQYRYRLNKEYELFFSR